MIITIDEDKKTLTPVIPCTIKELMDFADRWKLPLTKWSIAAPPESCGTNQ